MPRWNKERWDEVQPYLDEVLQLETVQREEWLAALAGTEPALAAMLRELLAVGRAKPCLRVSRALAAGA